MQIYMYLPGLLLALVCKPIRLGSNCRITDKHSLNIRLTLVGEQEETLLLYYCMSKLCTYNHAVHWSTARSVLRSIRPLQLVYLFLVLRPHAVLRPCLMYYWIPHDILGLPLFQQHTTVHAWNKMDRAGEGIYLLFFSQSLQLLMIAKRKWKHIL